MSHSQNRKRYQKTKRIETRRFSRIEHLENRTLLTINGFEADVAPVVDYSQTAEVSAPQESNDRVQRIVNGSQTSGYESVGIVNGQCTGTLIAPNAVLTAAHCLPEDTSETQTFEVGGKTYETERVAVHPGYNTSQDIDLAVMVLKENVVGIDPVNINRVAPQVGQMLTLVGFGGTGTAQGGHNDDFGVKHAGQTPIDELTPTHVNWNFDNATEANTAPGDSGGPAFLTVDGELVVAGVTSGGTLGSAALGDFSFDTRVDPFASWIDDVVQGNVNGTPTDSTPSNDGVEDNEGFDNEGFDNEGFDGDFGDELEDDFGSDFEDGPFLDDQTSDQAPDQATIEQWVSEELDDYDSNGDGQLSKQELVAEFIDFEYSRAEAREEANYLLDEFDFDGNQQLDFSELVVSYGGDPASEMDGSLEDGDLVDDLTDADLDYADLDWFGEFDLSDESWEFTLDGDVDLNGEVGFEDFLILSSHYGGEGEFGEGDINGDGDVGFLDFLAMSENFGFELSDDASGGWENSDRVLRIVNGTQTDDYESVGVVNEQCTGTLIAANAVLTAAHCVDAGSSPQTFDVEGQTYSTQQVVVHPDYQSNDIDLAVMVLNTSVSGVAPTDISRVAPTVGQTLTLVGFGATGTPQNGHNGSFGVKHVGQTPIDVVTGTEINWNYDNATEANTAPGDSGGPAFVNVGGTLLVAGVTSGGTQENAGLGDYSFDMRVDAFADWIDGIVTTNSSVVTPPVSPTNPVPTEPEPTDPAPTNPVEDDFDADEIEPNSEFEQYAADELDAYDSNGDGLMSRRELINEFMDLGDSRRDARDFADYLLDEFDSDGDNKLNLQELAATYGGESQDNVGSADELGDWDWESQANDADEFFADDFFTNDTFWWWY